MCFIAIHKTPSNETETLQTFWDFYWISKFNSLNLITVDFIAAYYSIFLEYLAPKTHASPNSLCIMSNECVKIVLLVTSSIDYL